MNNSLPGKMHATIRACVSYESFRQQIQLQLQKYHELRTYYLAQMSFVFSITFHCNSQQKNYLINNPGNYSNYNEKADNLRADLSDNNALGLGD